MVLIASDRVQLSFAADSGWKGRAGLNINSITFFVAIIITTLFVSVIIITSRVPCCARCYFSWSTQQLAGVVGSGVGQLSTSSPSQKTPEHKPAGNQRNGEDKLIVNRTRALLD